MSWLLLALTLASTCEHPPLACELLEQPAPLSLDRSTLGPLFERQGFERARQRNSGALHALQAQLWHWLEALFESSSAQAYSKVTRVLVLALALAVGLGLCLRFLGGRRRKAPDTASPPSPTTSLQLDDPALHLARAESGLSSAPREALREGLLCLLACLERRRLAQPDRVKTNRELAQELSLRGAPPELVAKVGPLLAWFDGAFYSLGAVPHAGARDFIAQVRRLMEEP